MKRVIFGSSGCIGKSLCELTVSKSIEHVALNSHPRFIVKRRRVEINNIVNDGDDVVIPAALPPKKDTITNLVKHRYDEYLTGLEAVKVRHVVYISSDAVYSQDITNIKSNTPKCPSRLYGHAHLLREEMLKHVIDSRRWTIIRPCAVYSHNDTHNAYGVMRFWRETFANNSITLYGNGEECRDHIHADDVAAIIDHALARSIQGEFNACSGQAISFLNLALMIKAKVSNPVTIN